MWLRTQCGVAGRSERRLAAIAKTRGSPIKLRVEGFEMKQRAIVTVLSSAALFSLAGCSTTSSSQSPGAQSAVIEQRPSELAGTWLGEFYQVGADSALEGQVTLEVKDDGTYKMTARRAGSGPAVESGVIETRGNTVTLKSTSGSWTPLQRSGEKLYGMTLHSSGRPIKITVERQRG
jgi:hypothetical protein